MGRIKTRKTVDDTPARISQAAVIRATALADRLIAWMDDPDLPDPLARKVDTDC